MHLILWKSKNVKHLSVFWDLGHICMGSFQIPVSREHKMQITPAMNNARFVSHPQRIEAGFVAVIRTTCELHVLRDWTLK